nr:response regulator [Vulgatibacter incomptus]
MAPLLLIVDDNRELADLLAQIFEEAGYRTKTCYRGKAALDAIAAETPAVAVVDILLPDLVGHEVAKVLAAKKVPFLFVTGVFKGAKHSLEGRSRHGASGWFEKPFEASKLLEAVREIVPAPKARPRQPEFEVELDIDVDEREYTPIAALELTGRISVSGPSVKAVLTGEDVQLRAPPAPPPLLRAPPLLRREEVSPDGRSRTGDLADNLPQLFTAFWQLQETGELGLQRGKVKKVIYFEKGQPVFALSNLAADRFGTFLMRVGKIDEAQLTRATTEAAARKRRTGDILIEMGLLQDAERMYYVAQQVKSILYSVFAWREGSYTMSFQAKARHEPIRLGIHPAQLISRGIKKLYTPERLQRLLALEERLVEAKDPAYRREDLELDPWEANLLSRIDGHRTVAELVARAEKPSEMAISTLVTLLSLKVVEKRG